MAASRGDYSRVPIHDTRGQYAAVTMEDHAASSQQQRQRPSGYSKKEVADAWRTVTMAITMLLLMLSLMANVYQFFVYSNNNDSSSIICACTCPPSSSSDITPPSSCTCPPSTPPDPLPCVTSPSMPVPFPSSRVVIPRVDTESDRLILLPVLRQGLNNQIISLQELIKIAVALNATLCWPLVNLEGTSQYFYDGTILRSFDALFNSSIFERRLYDEYGVRMVSQPNDIRLCKLAFATHYMKNSGANEECRKVGIHDDQQCLHMMQTIRYYHETPYDIDWYNQHYEAGGRLIYMERTLQQWYQPLIDGTNRIPTIQILVRNVLQPANHLLAYIDTISDYYDQVMVASNTSYVIGLHLRIESDLWICGNVPLIMDRLCNDASSSGYGVNCSLAMCIIATGASRDQWQTDIATRCHSYVAKHDAWLTRSLQPPVLSREESALIDLWTVTRAHVFVSCPFSTMGIGGKDLHALRFNQWIHPVPTTATAATTDTITDNNNDKGHHNSNPNDNHSDDITPSSLSISERAMIMARRIDAIDTGTLLIGPGFNTVCYPDTITWLHHHHMDHMSCQSDFPPSPSPSPSADH